MGREQSVAPKERVNIKYKPATGDAKEEIELPFRMLVLGDFTLTADDTPVEERQKVNINKDNFNDVLREQKVAVDLAVPDKLAGGEGDEMSVKLKFESIKDFNPDQVVQQVPELKKLLDVRNALESLKGPLGNMRNFRGEITKVLEDSALVDKLMSVVEAGAADAAPAEASADDAPSGDAPDGGGDAPAPEGDA